MKTTITDLPPNLQPFASLLDPQPPGVQEPFQFLLATTMHEGGNPRFGKFELLSMAEVEGRWHYTFSGAGEVFSVVRPEMSKEMERRVGEEVREMREPRYVLGRTDQGRRLFVVFTPRRGKIRVISAREMTKRERAFYPL